MGAIGVGANLRRGNPSSPTYTHAIRQQKDTKRELKLQSQYSWKLAWVESGA